MSNKQPSLRIGIYGHDSTPKNERHGCGLWKAGYAACLEFAEAESVFLPESPPISWSETLADVQGVLIVGHDGDPRRSLTYAEVLAQWCRENEFWFALGIQWHPASATASGLDIQVFRGLIAAAQRHSELAAAA